jgi:glycolate oxidase
MDSASRCLLAIERSVGGDKLVTDPEVCALYSRDRSGIEPTALPLAVLRAESEQDVVAALREADTFRVPVVPRGAGSGLAGGAVTHVPSVVVSLERMRSVDIDEKSLVADVGPGLLNAELKEAAKEVGLWYPPDPSSFEFCSLGGNVATNAGGLCCVKYGVTSDYVVGLRVVLPGGRLLALGRPVRKNVVGYDLKRLFVGSEGTLGVVTRVQFRLVALPTIAPVAVGSYADGTAAARDIVEAARQSPQALEFMDGAAVRAVNAGLKAGLEEDLEAIVFFAHESLAGDASLAGEVLRAAKEVYLAKRPEEIEAFWRIRREAIPCVEKLTGHVLIEDVGVPLASIPHLMAAVRRVSEETGVLIPTIGHAGEGNFHPLIVWEPGEKSSYQRALSAFGRLAEAALELGGTVSGEHGVGTLKIPYAAKQMGEDEIAVSWLVKRSLDPNNVMNPGKLLPPATTPRILPS